MTEGPTGFHPGTLSSGALESLRRHARSADKAGFYLAGGTALALELGHRRSVDFDWFREDPSFDPLNLAHELASSGVPLEVQSTSTDTLHATVRGVRVSFFRYRYRLLEPLREWKAEGCRLASPKDIAAMKLAAVAQRGAKKDFYDVAALGRAGLELPAMLEAYRSKFSTADIAHVLTALTWFDDAERDADPESLTGDRWDSVKQTMRAWVKAFAR